MLAIEHRTESVDRFWINDVSILLTIFKVTTKIMQEENSENSFILTSPRSKISVHSSGVSQKIRLGLEYQTEVPEVLSDKQKEEYELKTEEPSLMLWSSTTSVSDKDIEDFVNKACKEYKYSSEQAHGMLYWHQYCIDKASEDLANFTPSPDEWNDKEKLLFEKGFQWHGKQFELINKLLPRKNMKALIQYYYLWKKDKKSVKRKVLCEDLNPKESFSKRFRTEPIVREIAVKRYKS